MGGISVQVVFNAEGPTKQVIRVPTQLEYCATENLSTFEVASPHLNMLGVLNDLWFT